jgi:DNA-binding protein Fis
MDRWGNVSRVAKAMGVSRATLRRRLTEAGEARRGAGS